MTTDEQYLIEVMPEATPDQVENFVERVAIAVIDGGVEEENARRLALESVFG